MPPFANSTMARSASTARKGKATKKSAAGGGGKSKTTKAANNAGGGGAGKKSGKSGVTSRRKQDKAKDETETEPPMKEVDVNPASSSESDSEDENSKAKAKTTAAKGKKGKADAKKTKKAAGKAAGGGKRTLRLRKKVRYEDDASLSGSDGEDGGKITTKATTKGVLKKRTRPSTPTTDPEDCSADEGGEKKPLLDSYAAATAGDSGVGYGSGGDWRVASVMDW